MIRLFRSAVAKEQGIRLASLDELYAAADYITLHVGLTPQTAGMINEAAIKKMKKGVRLVNCARGELVNEADLAQALKQGHVAAAALDVFQRRASEELAAAGDGECYSHAAHRRIRLSRRRKPWACRSRSRCGNT